MRPYKVHKDHKLTHLKCSVDYVLIYVKTFFSKICENYILYMMWNIVFFFMAYYKLLSAKHRLGILGHDFTELFMQNILIKSCLTL